MTRWDPRALLSLPQVFDGFNKFIGSSRFRQFCVEHYIQPRAHDAILDLGCGTAEIAAYLPAGVRYTGVDSDAGYIEACRRRYGATHYFVLNETWDLGVIPPGPYQRILALGVLHHLDDGQAQKLFQLARRLLAPEGKLITYDGCRVPDASWVETGLLNMDRGDHIRDAASYQCLAAGFFSSVETHVHRDLLRIPYPHFFMSCS
jgi:SAM-dependent methyltransferase